MTRTPKPPENHAVTVALAALILVTGGGFAYWNHSRLSAPPPPVAATASPAAAARPGFPPATPAAFRSFAATGDAAQVREVASAGEGLPSCPQTARYVTVSPGVTGRALEADLSAYFVQNGLLGNQCGAVVFAYHSLSDYQRNNGNGYTAGRVILSGNNGSGPYSLEVDAGSDTGTQAEFGFSF
jgi:hypothetical protein